MKSHHHASPPTETTDSIRLENELLFDLIGRTSEIAKARGVSPATVSGWKARGVPIEQWKPLSDMAAGRGQKGVSIGRFAELAVRRAALTTNRRAA